MVLGQSKALSGVLLDKESCGFRLQDLQTNVQEIRQGRQTEETTTYE
jgi:hypothetical protein